MNCQISSYITIFIFLLISHVGFSQSDLRNMQFVTFSDEASNEKLFMMNTIIDDAIRGIFHRSYFEKIKSIDSAFFFSKVPEYFDSLEIDDSWKYKRKMRFFHSSKLNSLNIDDILITKRINKFTNESKFIALKVNFELNDNFGIHNFEFLDLKNKDIHAIETKLELTFFQNGDFKFKKKTTIPPPPPLLPPKLNANENKELYKFTIRSSFDWHELEQYNSVKHIEVFCRFCVEIPIKNINIKGLEKLTIEAVLLELDQKNFKGLDSVKWLYIRAKSFNKALENLPALEHLGLYLNAQDSFPHSIFQLKNLTTLELERYKNQFIDTTLISKSIKILWLKRSNIPPLFMFENLEFVRFYQSNVILYAHNNIVPGIKEIHFINVAMPHLPNWLLGLKELEKIKIRRLRSSLPDGLEKIPSLKVLDLTGNVHKVPESVLTKLKLKPDLTIFN